MGKPRLTNPFDLIPVQTKMSFPDEASPSRQAGEKKGSQALITPLRIKNMSLTSSK